jgi:disulfide bond formation protein DsbB
MFGVGAIGIALVMAIAIGACGGGREKNSEEVVEAPPTAAATEAAAAPAEVAIAPVSTGDAAKGEEIYSTICIACHGPGGSGVQNLGKPMTTSDFIHDMDDAALLAFIKQGRDTSSPDNTTGVAMPPKGGNPAFTDEQIMDVIAYIRTINNP